MLDDRCEFLSQLSLETFYVQEYADDVVVIIQSKYEV